MVRLAAFLAVIGAVLYAANRLARPGGWSGAPEPAPRVPLGRGPVGFPAAAGYGFPPAPAAAPAGGFGFPPAPVPAAAPVAYASPPAPAYPTPVEGPLAYPAPAVDAPGGQAAYPAPPVDPTVPPPNAPPGWRPPLPAGGTRSGRPARDRGVSVASVVAVLLLVAVAVGGHRLYRDLRYEAPPLTTPATLGGLAPNRNPAFAELDQESMRRFRESGVKRSVNAMYGPGLVPTYSLSAGRGVDRNRDRAIATIRASGDGLRFGPVTPVTTASGHRVDCASVSMTRFNGAACVWHEDGATVTVFTLLSTDQAGLAAVTAEAAVATGAAGDGADRTGLAAWYGKGADRRDAAAVAGVAALVGVLLFCGIRRVRGLVLLAVAVPVGAAAYGFVGDRALGLRAIPAPTTLGGHARVVNTPGDDLGTRIASSAERDGGRRPMVAFYGDRGRDTLPTYVLFAARHTGYANATEVMDSVRELMWQQPAGAVGASRTVRTATGHDVECAEFAGRTPGVVCVWQQGGTIGRLIGFTPGAVAEVAEMTGEAIEAAGAG